MWDRFTGSVVLVVARLVLRTAHLLTERVARCTAGSTLRRFRLELGDLLGRSVFRQAALMPTGVIFSQTGLRLSGRLELLHEIKPAKESALATLIAKITSTTTTRG